MAELNPFLRGNIQHLVLLRTNASQVNEDRGPGQATRNRRSTHALQLVADQWVAIDANFPDNPSADVCLIDSVVDPHGYIPHDGARQVIDGPAVHVIGVEHALVVTRAHNDVESA